MTRTDTHLKWDTARPDDINLWLWNDSAELVKVLKFAPPPGSIAMAYRPGEGYPNWGRHSEQASAAAKLP